MVNSCGMRLFAVGSSAEHYRIRHAAHVQAQSNKIIPVSNFTRLSRSSRQKATQTSKNGPLCHNWLSNIKEHWAFAKGALNSDVDKFKMGYTFFLFHAIHLKFSSTQSSMRLVTLYCATYIIIILYCIKRRA